MDDQAAGNSNLSGYDEVVLTKNMKTIDAISSHVIILKAGTAHTGERINVMTQALQCENGSLPQGMMVQNAYTELRKGSKNVVVVVRNSTAYPQTLRKKTSVVRAVSYWGTRASCADWLDRGARRGPWPSNAQVTCKAKVREVV